MDRDIRSKQVSDIYQKALAQPATARELFLREACGEDETLRREVASLLALETAADRFLEIPAAAMVGHLADAAQVLTPPDLVGRTLGAYTLTSRLGSGGMGVVYRARDSKLGRDVAIKILPPHFTNDAERRARFAREARVLATLNHPNIGAIYGLEEAEGTTGLVLELIQGETLADRIARGPLAIGEALVIARQIADAVTAAHDKGIIHRDLKPPNIVLQGGAGSHDPQVKVVDFGLAKPLTPDSDIDLTQLPHGSVEAAGKGRLLGTPAYMSPEQARGRAVDKRADVWAFGCMLYEMLTGRQAFGAETVTDTIAAVVKNDPNWSVLPGATPAGIRELLRRCLEKDPKRRLRDLGDAGVFLDEPSVVLSRHEPRAPRKRRIAVLLAVALIAVPFTAGWSARRGPAATVRYRGDLLTTPPAALTPRVSPDGQMVAFTAIVNGLMQVAVARPESGSWAVLTKDRDKGGFVEDVAWEPDGSAIYFDRVIGAAPLGVYRIPVLGGEPRLVVPDAMRPEPLADGSLLVVRITEAREKQLFRFRPDTGDMLALNAVLTPSGDVRAFPDGREAVFHGRPADQRQARQGLYVIDVQSNGVRMLPLAVRLWWVPIATTRDGREVLIARPFGDLTEIVAVPRDGSNTSRVVTTVPPGFKSIDTGADGTIYWQVFQLLSEIIVAAPTGTLPNGVPLVFGRMDPGQLPLPDGRVLVPTQANGRSVVLAVTPERTVASFIESTEETRPPMTTLGGEQVVLFVGKKLAIVSIADGRIVRRLDALPDNIDSLTASQDGQTLFFVADGAAWTVGVAGGTPRKIAAAHGLALDRDGRNLFVTREEPSGVRVVRVPLDGGPEREIPIRGDIRIVTPVMLSTAVGRDGRILVYIQTNESWYWRTGLLDPRTGHIEQLWPDVHAAFVGAWTPDGRIAALVAPHHSRLWRFTPLAEDR